MREVRRFAWLPVELATGKTVWLERYLSREWLKRRLSMMPELAIHGHTVLAWEVRERLPR